MKLRLQGNTVRLRLTRPEVARLRDEGAVEETVEFAGSGALRYRLRRVETALAAAAEFRDETIAVSVSAEAVRKWADSEEVGIYAQMGPLKIAIEKDFRCLTVRADEQDPGAYPRPARRS